MVPVLAVNIDQSGSPFYTAAGIGRLGGAARADGALDGTLSPPALKGTDLTALTQIDAAVSQLLQSIGVSAEDDEMLRMLIGLIIVLALLENSQDEASGAQSTLLSPGSGGHGSGSVELSLPPTMIAIEQTKTTILLPTAGSPIRNLAST